MIQQSPTEERADPLCLCCCRRLSEHNAKRQCPETTYFVASQAAQPAEADGVERIMRDMLAEVMQDAWGEICDDSGAHPLDMKHGRGSILFYQPGHWTDLIALRLNERLAATPKAPASPAVEEGQLRAALRSIAEGNLGDAPWQANYKKIKQVAASALATPPAPNDDLRAALEARDKKVAECPDKKLDPDQDCPRCGASSNEGCRITVIADAGFVRAARAALKENRRG